MSDDVFLFHEEDFPTNLYESFEGIRRRAKLCDVTLKVEERKFSAHRIVLSACIPYFNAMFTHDMMEAKQEEIVMQGIDSDALESLINYAYNGRILINSDNVQSLMVGACFLQIQSVKDACSQYLQSHLSVSNVIGMKRFAEQFVCASLSKATNKYIQEHFVQVSNTAEWLELELADVLKFISEDNLAVGSEEQVFDAAMTWLKHDLGCRGEYVPQILVRVRLPLLSPEVLSDKVATEETVKCSLPCRDLLDEARDFHLLPERRPLLQSFKTRPRRCSDVVGVVYAVGGLTSSGASISTVECFDPVVSKWHIAEPMNTLRSRVGAAVLNGKLYAIGGYDGHDRLSTVEMFDPLLRRWSLVSPMTCKRSALSTVSFCDRIYVCGGYDGVQSLNSVEYYTPKEDKWVAVCKMSCHRSAAGMAVLDSNIVVLGGHDGLSIFDSMESYSPSTNEWTILASMLSKRCRLGVTTLNNCLYACGGYDGSAFLESVEIYCNVTNQWTFIRPMLFKRSRVALVANCGRLYAIGGYDGYTNLSSVEMYDTINQEWTLACPMVAHEGGVGVVVLPLEATSIEQIPDITPLKLKSSKA